MIAGLLWNCNLHAAAAWSVRRPWSVMQTDKDSITLQVRASVPMYLLSRKIKAGGFKVVMSGEGADEIYGGYLFFHKAPTPKDFQQ
jgi:asparagine synthetase B (glutamine-hydrolysing)